MTKFKVKSDTAISFETGSLAPLIILPVTVNDLQHEKFILDIGSSNTLLTTEFANRQNINITHYKEGVAAGGTVKVGLGTVKSIKVGDVRYENFEVGITDEVKKIATAIGKPEVSGNLGYSFLKGHILNINYPDKKIRITTAENFTAPEGNKNKFVLANITKPVVVAEVYIDGKGPFSFILDTGASITSISNELANSLGLALTPGPEITAGGGKVKTSVTTLSEIKLGNDKEQNVTVLVAGYLEMLSKATGKKIDGVLGYDFMKNYEITIDYVAGNLYLKK
jgi:predicted aspartyl protease